MSGAYVVMVDDNFHYMDEEERYELGTFASADEALAACRTLVDRSLAHLHTAGMTAEELYYRYTSYGEDPFIPTPAGAKPAPFSAWTYARQRAREVCAGANPKG